MSEYKYSVWVDDDNVSNSKGGEDYLNKVEAEALREVWVDAGWHNTRIEEEE